MGLLNRSDPAPVTIFRPEGRSRFFLICDHAGCDLPASLGDMGLPEEERRRHIAWDIGASGVARRLSDVFDATLIEQRYSRLVIDCNRRPSVSSAFPEISETTPIPGNVGLAQEDKRAREEEIFRPYHRAISEALDERDTAGHETIVIAVHSFTPVFEGFERPWHLGILFNRDRRVADAILSQKDDCPDLVIGENEPYAVGDETDYSIPVHGEKRGLLHVELEIRQDMIAEEAGQFEWADRLTTMLNRAADTVSRMAAE